MNLPGYEILRPIAEGGMASVYLAVQQSLGRYVALKLLKKFDNPEQARRFQNEGRIIASLNHRNIITIYDIGACGDRHYISMEYLEGGSLEARIQAGMNTEAALDILEVIGGCLEFLHCKEIIHRDIKPANILFHKDGTPILTDFGVARQLEADMRLTMEGSAVGSPHYLSPEQAECKPLDGRADIYGLGIIFHEMLTGVKPYQGDSHIETILAHLTEPLPVLPPALQRYQDLLERMIAKDPDERFASAGEMLEYLRRLRLSGQQGRAAGGWFAVQRTAARVRKRAQLLPRQRVPAEAAQGAFRAIKARWASGSRLRRGTIAVVLGIAAAGLLARLPSLLAVQETNPRPVAASWEAATDPVRAAETPAVAVLASIDEDAPDDQPAPETAEQSETGQLPAEDMETGGEPAATGRMPAQQAAERPAAGYENLLLQARRALDEYRLTTPDGNNAYYYYRRVLREDPGNREASAGVARIASIYANLAEQELDRFRYPKARTYISRGLAVDPDNAHLRELESRSNFTSASRRAFGRVKALFQ